MAGLERYARYLFPALTALCDRHGLVVTAADDSGGRGEWYLCMRSGRFQLCFAQEVLDPYISIKALHGRKRGEFLDKVLQELGLLQPQASRPNESELAALLESNLDLILRHLENDPAQLT